MRSNDVSWSRHLATPHQMLGLCESTVTKQDLKRRDRRSATLDAWAELVHHRSLEVGTLQCDTGTNIEPALLGDTLVMACD